VSEGFEKYNEQYESYSEDPRWVFYEGRGGFLRCGEFVEFLPGYRMRVLTNPGTKIPTTTVTEAKKLSPQAVCDKYNDALSALRDAREIVAEYQECDRSHKGEK
jgi:hypothetical protein